MFISHCHTNAIPFGMDEKVADAGTLERLTLLLNQVGAAGGVAFAPFDYQYAKAKAQLPDLPEDANEWLASRLPEFPELVGFASLYPLLPDVAERLERAVELGLVGCKIHPGVHSFRLDQPEMEPFYTNVERLGLPVHLHTGVHGNLLDDYRPLLLDRVFARHEGLRLIMDHCGGYAFFNEALAVLQNRPNAYAGITQMSGRASYFRINQERLTILLDSIGPRRLVFGLDSPWNPDNLQAARDDAAWISSWPFSEEGRELVLGGNIRRLIGLE